ncbi:magnesium/cobalt transporter CorA [Campylobacter troglodytis]|uniref:magnesium/cobalt transporter CorA n=1 Tax=Campylobacter troglodytis TaxID=654363 RepID=UPI001157368C|nr:magnesium/cobalt transporter CorA [Campylobacter troglodytis]TQR61650.1 magnesium and cobalt transport protein CorA [Campylobacter troglodytis]
MLTIYKKADNGLVQKIVFDIEDNEELPKKILWVDLLHPTLSEINYIAKYYNLDIPDLEEREEIELSARYWEDSTTVTINTHFLVRTERNGSVELDNETITFMTAKQTLFTLRYNDFTTFTELQARILASPKNFEDGFDIIDKIFEVRVEKDADILEWIDRQARKLRIEVLEENKREFVYDKMLRSISSLQELNTRVRDSLFDKRRAMTCLLKSDKVDKQTKQNITIVLKDLNSLVEFNVSQLNILDNIQTILAGQLNIEQNKTIKLFTVATMAMMPPTLIGTVYGMNFEFMPELQWEYSYPVVLVAMVISIIIPVIFFKKKGWL